jgi:hypothetical protein
MDVYSKIEQLCRDKYGKAATTKKAIGDFMLTETHAVNVKSNNVNKQNYSPNMISIKKMHKWVFEERHELSFIFVDYRETGGEPEVINMSDLIPIEHLSWNCLSIEAQGYGVIQMSGEKEIIPTQTKSEFYRGFLTAYEKYKSKEKKKHDEFSKRLMNPDNIDW